MLAAFVALQSVIVVAWWGWLAPRSAGLTAAERLMCAVVMAVAQVVGASLLLGWCGALSPWALLLVVGGATGAVLLASRRRSASPAATGAAAANRAVAAEPVPAGDATRRRAGPEPAPSIWIRRANVALVVLLVPTLALIVARGVLAPNFGWDGLRYHLPMSALMLQTGQLDLPPAHHPVIAAYPKSAEIWAHWILAWFGNDRWVGLAQLPFLGLAMLATYNAARRLAAGRAAAATGAVLLACVPVVLSQITVVYNDVFLAALVLVAVALALAARQSVAPALPVALGATLGLLLGSKFTALLFAPILYAAFALAVLRAGGRRALPGLALAAGLAVLLGGDTYLRNAWQHGNPVYPYRTTVLGWTLPGPLADTQVYGIAETRDVPPAERLLRSWSAVDVIDASPLYGGFGAAAPLLVLVFAVALVVAVRERDEQWLMLFALFAILVVLTPLNFRLRFVLYLLGFAGICLGRLLERGPPRARPILLAATIAVAAVTCEQLWAVALPQLRDARGVRADACREAPQRALRPAYLWLREHAPAGSTVLTFPPPDSPFAYCLWTPTFSNRVEFTTADSAAALTQLAVAREGAIFFLPHGSPVYAAFVGTDPGRWQTLFADEAVTIVTPAGAVEPPP